MARFDESKHPRDKDGEFTDGSASSSMSAKEAKQKHFKTDTSLSAPSAKEAKDKHFGGLTDNEKNANISGKVYQIKKIDNDTYEIPLEVPIKYGSFTLKRKGSVKLTDVITIIKPNALKDQARIAQNYGGGMQWSKNGGNAEVEISGTKKKVQIHYYDNPHAGQAEFKIIQKKRKKT